MYRQLGGSAVLLLLVTSAISHVVGPSRGTLAVHSESGSPSTSSTESSAVEADEHTCYVFEALRLYAGIVRSPSKPAASPLNESLPSSLTCSPLTLAATFPSGIPQIDTKESQVLIATVPDPLQSSEALQFDRDIAALQEAASTAGYDFQRISTPWQASDLSDPKDFKDAREVERYRQSFGDEPGAILFRKRTRADRVRLDDADSLLLLVLVPESPIYGLNLTAGREALDAVRTLLSQGFRTTPAGAPEDASRIRWIGPSYSASAPGLRTLEQETQPHLSFDVLSGTVSTNSATAFLVKLDQDGRWASAGGGTQTTLTELDQSALCWFLGQTSRPGMHSDEPVVVLQEDETAYGGNISDPTIPTNPCSPFTNLVRRFTFPRGISHVRRLYGSTLKSTAASQPEEEESSKTNGTVSLSFRDELKDPLDEVPEFAPQSPVSNESVLAAIASSIKHLHARAIVIRTSDPLDQLFLARYFRQECPDSRLVLFNAERLLTRLRGDFNLDGTLIVTRFPLFQNSYLQTPFRGESRHSLSFTNSREEAIFLAALLQIKPGDLPLRQSPFGHQHFAMAPWIGVASGGDFWPVAYFGKDPVGQNTKAPGNVLLLTDTPPEPLPVLWTLVTLATLGFSVVHFLCFLAAMPLHTKLRHSRMAWARKIALHKMLSYYLSPPSATCEQSRLFTGQCWWLLNISTQLVLVLSYLLFPALAYQAKVQNVTSVLAGIQHFPMQTTMFAGFTLIVLMSQFCMAGTLFLLLSRRCKQLGKGFFNRFEGFLLPCISLLWVLLSLTLFCLQLADKQTGFAFASRSLHLSSGVCPILPLLLVSVGFLIAAVVNLNALSMAVTRNPALPLIHWPYLDLASWQIRLTGFTELWYGLPGMDGKLLAAVVFLVCLLLHPQKLFATFDTPYIGWLYTFNFVLSIWTVLWLWVRFTRIWGVLRGGLDSLEGSPLRFAFSRLPSIFSVDPIWSYSGLRRVVTLPMRWFEYLKVAPPVADEKQSILTDNLHELRTILQEMRDAQWLDNRTYCTFSHKQNEYAIQLSEVPAIRASWERGGPDCSISGASTCKPEKSEEGENKEAHCPQSRADIPSPCGTVFGPDNCLVEIGNEFIAMRVGAYVRYVTLQMKNLMTFMSLGFLLTLLAAISYPFDRPQIIAWAATLTLAALLFTVGTVLAQMDRDAILSRMSNSTPGQVRYMAFVKHMLAVGGLPIVTVLATLFPAIGSYLFSWAAPILESLH
ncbi:hypothetical protein H7849_18730 [Alloacidobacterium dinghuense]|uniref:Uncharacterized protein n=1 Tax=Alloacidobacterium dinghuense TaxID=2763107 RepID=A0A7G8BF00_9BACT|nr:hypothetical protein [Alloacidobacterium dinghuense]QNI31120.1 hypothetical protein H7849_18730 [Alloacidobacterium dinghuense]